MKARSKYITTPVAGAARKKYVEVAEPNRIHFPFIIFHFSIVISCIFSLGNRAHFNLKHRHTNEEDSHSSCPLRLLAIEDLLKE